MNKLLVTRNRKKSTEQGFSIAVSTGFGLIIMIIGLTLMGRAMKDSSVSAAQKITSRGDAAAQTGTARFMAFVASNPKLASYPVCIARNDSGTCTDTNTTQSWANASTTTTPGLTAAQIAEAKTYANWQDIDTTKPERGQFRVLSYTFSGNGVASNVNIEGRVGQVGSGNTAKKDIQTGSAEAASEVYYTAGTPGQTEQISEGTTNTNFPGIWMTEAPGNIGNQFFSANGLLENSYTGTNQLIADPATVKNAVVNTVAGTTPLRIADFRPAKPNSGLINLQTRLNALNGNTKATLPAGSDTPTTRTIDGIQTDVYEYYATNIEKNIDINTVNSSGSGTAKPTKVIIYLEGNIKLSGNKEINNICKNRSGSTTNVICDLSNLQIYGYKTTSNPNPTICFNGGNTINGFIVAPDHKAGLAGGGNGYAVEGALWAKSWGNTGVSGCDSSSNQGVVKQKGNAGDIGSYFPSTTTITRSVIPATTATPATLGRQAAAAQTTLTGSP